MRFMTVIRVDVINDKSMQLRKKSTAVEEGYLFSSHVRDMIFGHFIASNVWSSNV